MSTAVAPAPAAPAVDRGRSGRTDVAIARRAFHQVWIGATICALVFGLTVASTALTYATTFPSEAARQQLAAVTSNDAGLAILLGPIASIETIGGYTVYKLFLTLTTAGAIWALLAATRLLRGEEDTGRWQLILAGATRASRATTATMAALGAAIAVVFVGTLAGTLLAGASPDVGFGFGASVLYALSLMIAPAVFASVGALTSQIGRTRRLATGLGLGVFGITFVLRMLGDAGPGTHWMLWATPFGWTELMAPFTQNNAWPLVPAALTVIGLGTTAAVLAARRDVGAGLLASHDASPLRPFGLRTSLGLTTRLEMPTLVAWCVGAAGAGLVMGIIAKMTTASIPASMTDTLEKFGVRGAFVNQFLGVAFLLVATIVALLPAGQLGAAADEETSGRLVHVLARPTERVSWFAGRLLLTGAAVLVAGILAGLATWAGAASQGVDVDLTTMLGAGLNVVPISLVSLGLGAVVLAIAPRAAAGAVYVVVLWSVVDDLLSSMVSSVGWLDHFSLFHYLALYPAQPMEATTLVATTAVALGLCVLATGLFARRDLRTG